MVIFRSPYVRAYRWILLFTFCAAVVGLAHAQSVPVSSNVETLSLDKDLITFGKWAVGLGGVFLAAFTLIGVVFFGFDVRQTRKAMFDAREEITKRMNELNLEHQAYKELKDRLEKLGARLVEQLDEKTSPNAPTPSTVEQNTKAEEAGNQRGGSVLVHGVENQRELLRQLIASSEFEWSTVGTLQKKTGLSREEVLELARNDPLIQRGTGRDGDVLFRLKEFNFPPGIGSVYDAAKVSFIGSGSRATRAFREALWDHAQEGKPTTGNVLGGQ